MDAEKAQRGRPPIPPDIEAEVVRMCLAGIAPKDAVRQMNGRLGQNKVYEIYRATRKSQ